MRANLLRASSYWPHIGIGVGIMLNTVGLFSQRSELIATGANVLTVCGLFLVQRRRNDRRNGGST